MDEKEAAFQEAMRLVEAAYEKQMAGHLDEAIALYQRSIEIYPTAEGHTFLGWAYSLQGRLDEAIAECRKAIAIDADFGNPYNDIGAYLIEKGKLDEAVEWLKKALKAKRYESYCFPYYNLGRIWETKGKWEEALECYAHALKERGDYKLARIAFNRLLALMN